jgi:hypothetical protein
MKGCLIALTLATLICLSSATVSAQTVVVMQPPAHVVYSPVVASPAPVVTAYSPVVVARPAPAIVVHQPVVPTVTYRPVVTSFRAPAYIPAGRPVIVRSKVYIPGQPVRNFFRAITP